MQEVIQSTNPLAPDNEKDDPKYGLKLLKDAVGLWNTGFAGMSRQERKAKIDYNRSYYMAKYDMQEFKDILDLDGEYSVINLPYDCLTVIIPYMNRLKDKYNQRNEIIQCDAIDPFIQGKKKDAKDAAIFKLKQAEQIKAVQDASGVQTEEFSDDDPKSEAEIDITYGFNRQEREEVIMENLINVVFYENDFEGVIKDRLFDDFINAGYAETKVYVDGSGRIKIRFVKPENVITSFSEWSDFRDWQYLGEIYYMSIMEVRLKYPGKVSEEELWKLSTTLVGLYGNPTTNTYQWNQMYNNALARPYDAWRVPVVELEFKTLYNLKKTVVTDKFGKDAIVEEVTNPKATVSTVSSPPYYVSYTGVYIMDTEHLLEWGLSKNMVKPEQNMEEIISSYSLYMYNNNDMTNKPMIETIIPIIKEMQLAKLQQLKIIAAAAPDGYDIDIATMSDISLDGTDATMSPLELYSIYKQTGMKYYKSIPDEGLEGGTRRVPINANQVPFSAKLEQLRGVYNDGLLALTNIVSNELDSGNIRNQAVGANVLQEAKATGESTSNYLYNAFLNLMQRTAKVVQLRGWDILMYGKKFGVHFYDGYRQALGTNKIEYFKAEATDDWGKTAFNIQIKTIIGDKDQIALEQNMQAALAADKIEFADTIDIREVARTNVKYAAYIMADRIARRKKQAQDNAMALSQQNENATVSAAKAKTDGEMQLEQVKASNAQAAALQERETIILKSQEEFNGILKAAIAKSVLDAGGKIQDIPSFVFEGLPLTKAIDHVNAMNYLQTMAEAQGIKQQEMEQAQQAPPPEQGVPQEQQTT